MLPKQLFFKTHPGTESPFIQTFFLFLFSLSNNQFLIFTLSTKKDQIMYLFVWKLFYKII